MHEYATMIPESFLQVQVVVFIICKFGLLYYESHWELQILIVILSVHGKNQSRSAFEITRLLGSATFKFLSTLKKKNSLIIIRLEKEDAKAHSVVDNSRRTLLF